MMIKLICWSTLILYAFQQPVEGEYVVTKIVPSPAGRLKHISTLTLHKDRTYVYTDASFSKDEMLSADTVKGDWYTAHDTLVTKNYNVKWLIRKNALVKLSVDPLRYKRR
jgi:hypothetical protein